MSNYKKLKILQINSVCGFGSTGRIATDLYKVIEEQGHECVIAYGRGEAPKNIKTIKIGSNMDNYIHVAKTRILDKHGFGSKKATLEFIKKVKEYNPDIIHLHNIHGYYINIEILFNYLRKSGKKVIWTLHDCWAFTGHCSHFDYVGCYKWKNGCNSCKQKCEYPASNLLDNSKWNYGKKKELFTSIDKNNLIIVTPSKWLANLVRESYLNKYKIEVINNGIDLNIFKPVESNFRKKYKIEDKKIILGVASVWNERKGLNYFVDLSKQIDKNYQIVIVGISEKQKKELPNNIIAITRTNNLNELVEIYSDSDIFFNPTLEEVLGLTNIESLACGIPVITFDTGGSVETINEKCGVIVARDNKDLYKELEKNINKEFNIKECIKQSSKFSKNEKSKLYIKFYESLIAVN